MRGRRKKRREDETSQEERVIGLVGNQNRMTGVRRIGLGRMRAARRGAASRRVWWWQDRHATGQELAVWPMMQCPAALHRHHDNCCFLGLPSRPDTSSPIAWLLPLVAFFYDRYRGDEAPPVCPSLRFPRPSASPSAGIRCISAAARTVASQPTPASALADRSCCLPNRIPDYSEYPASGSVYESEYDVSVSQSVRLTAVLTRLGLVRLPWSRGLRWLAWGCQVVEPRVTQCSAAKVAEADHGLPRDLTSPFRHWVSLVQSPRSVPWVSRSLPWQGLYRMVEIQVGCG
jgi:hypothetical protein